MSPPRKIGPLSAEKRKLLQARLQKESPAGRETIPRRPDRSTAPLSSSQKRLWFMAQLEPTSAAYVIAEAIRIRGVLDVGALERALAWVTARHASLRTAFDVQDGEPRQRIAEAGAIPLRVSDLRATPPADRGAEAQRRLVASRAEPFDLLTGPLTRVDLLRTEDEEHQLLLSMHHIVSDGWSLGVLLRELILAYVALRSGAAPELGPLPIDYGDFASWQRESLSSDRMAGALEARRAALAGAPASIDLPSDRLRGASVAGGLVEGPVASPACTATLRALGQREGATLFMVALAAFQVLLARVTGQEDLVIGTPVAGRDRPETRDLVGLLLDTVAVRTNLEGRPTFVELLRRTSAATLDALAHQAVPFERLVEVLAPRRDLGRHPIFDVLINFLNLPRVSLELGGLELSPLSLPSPEPKLALELYLDERPEGLHARLLHGRGIESERAQLLLDQLAHLFESVAAAPDSPIDALSLIPPAHRSRLPDPSVAIPRPTQTPVTLAIARWAVETPLAVAIEDQGRELSYRDLAAGAARVAARLLESPGVVAGSVVAVEGARSFGLYVSIVGVLEAGCVLLLVDPDLPVARRALMLRESSASARLRVGATEEAPWGGVDVLVDEEGQCRDGSDEVAALGRTNPSGPAYVFFTSGTTGSPKAVLGGHEGLAHFVSWERSRFEVGPGDRVAQLTALSFDVVLRDVFLPLTAGATLCLPPPGPRGADETFVWLARARITLLHAVPSVFSYWLSAAEGGFDLSALRCVFFAGEPLSDVLVEKTRALLATTARIVNLYGPTETTLAKLHHVVNDPPTLGIQPIGRPLPETQALVVSRGGALAGVGELGEILLRTPFRSRGYLRASEEDHARFFLNPWAVSDAEDILYRTGDLGRFRLDGALDIAGRLDHQVKVHGVRVEPAEVAAVLARHPRVASCAVLPFDAANPHEKRLVAFVVARGTVTWPELRAFLAETLPAAMLPAQAVFLEELPRTANGKLDRRALSAPAPDPGAPEAQRAPRGPVEEALLAVTSEVLGAASLGVDQNLFDAGAHSLLLTQIFARIRVLFGVDLPLRLGFEQPTVAGLAARIEEALGVGELSEGRPAPRRAPPGTDPAISFVQERLLFLSALDPESPLYHVSGALRLRGPLDVGALAAALRQIIRRHESLRTTFEATAGSTRALLHDDLPIELPIVDLMALPPDEREDRARREQLTVTQEPFDLALGPLLRAKILRWGAEEHDLLVTMHHVIGDAWSVGILVRELTELYRSAVLGGEAHLPALDLTFGDLARWQRENAASPAIDRSLAWWRGHLAGAPESVEWARRRVGPSAAKGGRREVVIPADLSAAITKLARHAGVTPFMVVLAAFELLVATHAGQDDLVVGVPIANRTRLEAEPLIGPFINTLALRGDLRGRPTFVEILRRTREACLGAFAHQDLPFEVLVRELNPGRSLAHSPLFQVMFVFQNAPVASLDVPGLEVQVRDLDRGTARFDLSLVLVPDGPTGEIRGYLEHAFAVFDEPEAARLVQHLEVILREVVADPSLRLSDLGSRLERALPEGWGDGGPASASTSVVAAVLDQARKTPDAIALTFEQGNLTYSALVASAHQVAAHLVGAGVAPGDLVGLYFQRSLELGVCVLGTLLAGAAFVPLDPAAPRSRVEGMLRGIDVRHVLTGRSLAERLESAGVRAHPIALPMPEVARTFQPRQPDPDALAYVIHTSGSTGAPKPVGVPHRGLANLAMCQVRDFDLGPADRVLAYVAPTFDVSVSEAFMAWTSGATLVVVPQASLLPGPDFADALSQARITVVSLPASVLAATPFVELPALRVLIVGGEVCPEPVARRWARGRRLFNCYGPTETTVCATQTSWTDASGFAGIGRPLDGVHGRVVDDDFASRPIGVAGELVLGGVGVARGYLGRPDLTAERFVPDPAATQPGARMYRSGDRARFGETGDLWFLGRVDEQIKLRGHRIEPGEIVSLIAEVASIREACVVVREDSPGEPRLVAYFVAAGEAVDLSEVRQHLKGRLPEAMLPAAYVPLDALPRTSTGKLDLRALPIPEVDQTSRTIVAPRDALETDLQRIWEDVLGTRPIGVTDHFFDVGGSSFVVLKLLTEVERAFGRKLPVATVFEDGTIEAMAARVRSEIRAAKATSVVRMRSRGELPPIFCVHPVGGNVLCYGGLIRLLAQDRPAYGLQARGADDDATPREDVVEMAQAYVSDLLAVRSEGPFALLGWSFGGVVAFEMARQLVAGGHEVGFLGLLDSSAPTGSQANVDELELFAVLMRDLVGLFRNALPEPLESLAAKSRAELEALAVEQVRAARLFRSGSELAEVRRHLRLYRSNMTAHHHYVPGPYAGRIVYFRAGLDDDAWRAARIARWEPLARGGMEVVRVPGVHTDMLKRPNADVLVERLKPHLAQFDLLVARGSGQR